MENSKDSGLELPSFEDDNAWREANGLEPLTKEEWMRGQTRSTSWLGTVTRHKTLDIDHFRLTARDYNGFEE